MGRDKQVILTIGVGLILISTVIGCAAETPASSPTHANTVTPKPSITRWPTVTPTVFFTATPRPIVQPEYATLYPSITPELIATQLAGSEAICPPTHPIDNQALSLLIEPTGQYGLAYSVEGSEDFLPALDDHQIINLLNQYGVMSLLSYLDHNRYMYFLSPSFQFLELTGDGIKELIIYWGNTSIYTCKEMEFVLLNSFDMDVDFRGPMIVDSSDNNRNGYPEVLFHHARWYGLYEFNGETLESLLNPELQGIWVQDASTGEVDFLDIDGDSVPEIVVYLGIPEFFYWEFELPYRKQWDTYTWNGDFYVKTGTEFEPPQYRFQAVIDADKLSLMGEYEKALSLYQDVIFSDKLDWWSREKRSYYYDVIRGYDADKPYVMPEPDPDEYAYLAAYARYRIMLLYLLQGWDSDAQVVYETLLAKHPEGTPGSIYARLAQLFREEYQDSRDMGQACQVVITEANMKSLEVLKYLGIDGSMGMSIYYRIQDICPFE